MSRHILALIATAVLVGGCSTSGSARGQWWFPTEAPAGGLLRYRVRYTERVADGPDTSFYAKPEETCAFVLRVRPSGEHDGVGARIVETVAGSGEYDLLNMWVDWFEAVQYAYDSDIHVTPTEVRFADGPILQGPWRVGDRIQYTWVWLTSGLLYAEVQEAGPDGGLLDFKFWAGPMRREHTATGTVRFEGNRYALRSVVAEWESTYDARRTRHKLTFKLVPSPPADPPQAEADATADRT